MFNTTFRSERIDNRSRKDYALQLSIFLGFKEPYKLKDHRNPTYAATAALVDSLPKRIEELLKEHGSAVVLLRAEPTSPRWETTTLESGEKESQLVRDGYRFKFQFGAEKPSQILSESQALVRLGKALTGKLGIERAYDKLKALAQTHHESIEHAKDVDSFIDRVGFYANQAAHKIRERSEEVIDLEGQLQILKDRLKRSLENQIKTFRLEEHTFTEDISPFDRAAAEQGILRCHKRVHYSIHQYGGLLGVAQDSVIDHKQASQALKDMDAFKGGAV